MRLYAESNFVLAWVLEQEEHGACEELIARAEGGTMEMAVPAVSLVEPNETLIRRGKERKELQERLRGHLGEIARTGSLAGSASEMRDRMMALLVGSAQTGVDRFHALRDRLVRCATVLPLDSATFGIERDRRGLGLEYGDRLVYASVIRDLRARPAASVFLNLDSDFRQADIQAELGSLDCRLLPRALDALAYIDSRATDGR